MPPLSQLIQQIFSKLDLSSFRLTSTNRWRVEALLGRDLAHGPLRARTQSALTSTGITTTTAAVNLHRHWHKKMDSNLSQTAIVSLSINRFQFFACGDFYGQGEISMPSELSTMQLTNLITINPLSKSWATDFPACVSYEGASMNVAVLRRWDNSANRLKQIKTFILSDLATLLPPYWPIFLRIRN